MPDHRGKFALNYEGPYVVKMAFSRGALILADMDAYEPILTPSYGTLQEGASQCTSFLYYYVKTKKMNKKKKCKKVDRKPKRAVYAKGEPKEREHEKI